MKIQFKIHENGCWIWQGNLNRNGYGRVYVNGRRLMAHRVIYEQVTGRSIPDGIQLDHVKELCGNRDCVNPAHMEEVTCPENIRRSSATKLSRRAVDTIRMSTDSCAVLAKRYGVSRSTISEVRRGITWNDEGTYAERRAAA